MEIRILEPKDAGQYRRIRLAALKNNPGAFSSSYEEENELPLERFEQRLGSSNSITFGAFEENELIGVVTLIFETKAKTNHRANIAAMYVTPGKRHSGIGKRLMQEAIKKAKETEGIEQIHLTVAASNLGIPASPPLAVLLAIAKRVRIINLALILSNRDRGGAV